MFKNPKSQFQNPNKIRHLSFKIGNSQQSGAGFTLLELLLVVSIIGIMAGFFMTTYPSSQKRARDTQRMSDLKQYQIALEAYANANSGFYPDPPLGETWDLDDSDPSNLCPQLLEGTFAASCPRDPNKGTSCREYRYWDGGTNGLGYALFVQCALENDPTTTFAVCSNGNSGVVNNAIEPPAPSVRTICGF